MTTPPPPPASDPTPTCPACAAPVLSGERFCEACGTDLGVDAPPPPRRVDVAASPDARAAELASTLAVHADCGGVFRDGWCDVCGERETDPRWAFTITASPRAGGASDRGRRHHENEDALALHDDGTTVVAVVCDGVSSTVHPERASAAGVDAALAVLRGDPTDLVAAHRAADDAVRRVEFTARPGLESPSATFLAATVSDDGTVRVGSLGDCRAYWLPDDDPASGELLTTDDSWAQEQVARGMDPDVAHAHPSAHVISRWLGRDADPAWRPRERTFVPDGPGRLLVCSDGLWNHARTAAELAAATDPALSPVDQAQRLVDFANASGGHDNITVAVVRVTPTPARTAP